MGGAAAVSASGVGGVLGLLDPESSRQLAGLEHLGDDVAAAEQVAADEQLGDGGPVRDRRQLLADARVGQDVDGRERRAHRLERGHGASREAARGCSGVPFMNRITACSSIAS